MTSTTWDHPPKTPLKIVALKDPGKVYGSAIYYGVYPSFRCRRGSNRLFLSLDVLRYGNAGRLDYVNDVDANAWGNLVCFGDKFPAHVAGNDGGHDDAVSAPDVLKNWKRVGEPLLHGVRLFRCLAGCGGWHLCHWSGVCVSYDAVRYV